MIIVSDTTPIITLLKINKLGLLKELFDCIVIPKAVYNELTSNRKFISSCEIKECIDIMKNSGRHLSEKLYLQLLDLIRE